MQSLKKTLNLSLVLLILFSILETYSYPIDDNQVKVENLTQCFEIVGDVTLEKKSFFYNDIETKEQCTKLAIAQKYKEDIFYPKYFHKCFPLCNSCSEYSHQKNDMKCLSCLNGFQLKQGNCYIDKNYSSTKRTNELNTILNTLNLNPQINSNPC